MKLPECFSAQFNEFLDEDLSPEDFNYQPDQPELETRSIGIDEVQQAISILSKAGYKIVEADEKVSGANENEKLPVDFDPTTTKNNPYLEEDFTNE